MEKTARRDDWNLRYCRCSQCYEISFSQSIPVETALLFRDAAPRMRCLSLWYGIGGPLVTSKEHLSAAVKQLMDDGGKLLDQNCLPKKSDEKRFVQWKRITYLNESCYGFCFSSVTGFCNSPGFDSEKPWPNVTVKKRNSVNLRSKSVCFFGWISMNSYTLIMVSKVQHRSETGLVSPSGSWDFGSYESHATAAMYLPEKKPRHLRSGAWNVNYVSFKGCNMNVEGKGPCKLLCCSLLFSVGWVSFLILRRWKGLYKLEGQTPIFMVR